MSEVATGNQAAGDLLRACVRPVYLKRFLMAGELCSIVGPRTFLHAGPPIDTTKTLGPMRGALVAALLYEREASSPEQAHSIVESGEVQLVPCHAVGAVGALAGIVTPHTPVVEVAMDDGRSAFAPLNEGLGRATRFGNFDEGTLTRLRWLTDTVTPVLDRAVGLADPVNMLQLQAEGIRRGDECHNRNSASSALVISRLAPAIVGAANSKGEARDVLRELADNSQFFLALSMATAKCLADAVHDAGPAGLVTAIAANGREIAIRVSGSSPEWFTTRAPVGPMQLLEGFGPDDACPAMGDSPVTETVGLGAFALTAAPSLARALGLDGPSTRTLVDGFRSICVTESPQFLNPWDDFRGTPFGISVAAVLATGIVPAFTTGYAHRAPGRGRVGAGILALPMKLFERADGGARVPSASDLDGAGDA